MAFGNHLPVLVSLLAVLTSGGRASLLAQSFTQLPLSIPGVSDGTVAWGDMDRDGKLDIVVAGDTGTGAVTRVYSNRDADAFTEFLADLPGIRSGEVALGDYNGDGFLDLAMSGISTTGFISRVYRNNGNNTFTDLALPLPGLEASALAWGDYDNDGDLDLFITGYTGSEYYSRILRNSGGDLFLDSGVRTIRGGAAGSAAWADFDNDGDLDLLFDGFTLDTASGQTSRLYRNNGGTFTNITAMPLTGMSESSVAWGDFDNDNDLDILMGGSVISGVRSYPTTLLYRNNSGTSFTSINTGMWGVQNCSVAWGDFNNDGNLDAALAGYNPAFTPFARMYRNNGGATFSEVGSFLPQVIDASLAWGDYDNDGDLDLLVSGDTGSGRVTSLFRNDSPESNTPPFAPSGLTAAVTGKSVFLQWNASLDADQFAGLTYNMRIGTSPGADNVFAGMADSSLGRRRLPAIGNVNQRLSWSLNLPVGTYYWSVQAIDHGLAGSAFPDEQVFTIPAQAPNVTTLFATNLGFSSATLRGSANPNGAATIVYFEYGASLAVFDKQTPVQSIGSGAADVDLSATLSNLVPATTYYFRAVASNSFGVVYGAPQQFITPIFIEVANLLGIGASALAWGDYDNDGDLDLLTAGGTSSNLVTIIYRNDGGTNFVDIQAGLPGANFGSVMWGDYDNDGDLDVLLTGSGLSRIYRNDGGVFTDINAGFTGLSTGSSGLWTDFDNDGDLDVFLSGGGSTTFQQYRNDSEDRFTRITNALPPVSDSALAAADVDNDGDQDLLITGYNFGVSGVGELSRLYLNNGRGLFTDGGVNLQRVSEGSVAWGDQDNDGDLDLLLTGGPFTAYGLLYTNNGFAGFRSVTGAGVPRMTESDVSWGDYDNDGDLDFLATGDTTAGTVTKVYRNDGGNVFRDSGAVLPVVRIGSVAWGDYDNDGRLDILLSGYTGSNYITRIYRNLSLTANSRPAAPTGLATTILNHAATLSWLAGTDANQSGGLTYNVRIGTAPGRSDILNAMAGEGSGLRRVPRMGNVNLRRSWIATNLVMGAYYWSVQAVDHAYAGSAFATEGTFTITAALLPPAAVTRPATNIDVAGATLQAVVNPKGAATTAFFEYGTTTNLGSATPVQNIGSGTTNLTLSATLSTLIDGTTYYFRIVGSNANGVVRGATLSFATALQFTNVPSGLPPLTGFSARGQTAAGDYDNDGDLDLALLGDALPSTHLYRNDGAGMFSLVTTNLPEADRGNIEWGDYDNDGRLDLLISGSPQMVVMRNEGNDSFSRAATFYPCYFATWVDYDNDGDLDISGYDSSYSTDAASHLYRNDEGTFVDSGIPLPRLTDGRMAWGDYDNDGDADLAVTGQILVTNYLVRSTRIYRNNGGGDFADINAPLTGLQGSYASWLDYDNDRDLDLVVNGAGPSGSQTILYRNDNGSFVDANANLPGSYGNVTSADYDNDGDADLLLVFDSTSRIYRNDNGVFVATGKEIRGEYPFFNWGDFDNDGDLDVLADSRLFRNNSLRANIQPAAPSALGSDSVGNIVTLRWAAASDPNQAGGHTYNIQVGTAPGVYDIISGAADSASGWRRLAAPALGVARLWKVELPIGNYYWRVQAIDHALAGSPFSSESSFTIANLPPAVVTDFATTNSAGQPTLNGRANPNSIATTAWFEYGITNFELRTPSQSLGAGSGWSNLNVHLENLVPERDYSWRIVASNALGVTRGVVRSFFLPQFTPNNFVAIPPISWADYDADRDLDILYTSSYTWDTALYRNDNTVATNIVARFVRALSGSARWADYDRDGDLDLAITGRDPNWVRLAQIYRNDGNDQFTPIHPPLIGVHYSDSAWADLDNDGDLDFLTIGGDSWDLPLTQLLINHGGDVFEAVSNSLPRLYNGTVACADYDNDGDVDVLLSGSEGQPRVCKLYRNNGQAAFADSGIILPPVDLGGPTWGDYDGDGDPDILLTGRLGFTNNIARIYRNDPGAFSPIDLSVPAAIGVSAWLDYDNDGRLDFVVRGETNGSIYGFGRYTLAYRNLGNGNFSNTALTLALPNLSDTPILVGDYDNDGDVDLGFAQQTILRNESNIRNLPPNAPSGPAAFVASNSVLLTWNAASDPNQAGGFSYNVRVGTSPGLGNIVSPMAGLAGHRLVPEVGNAFGRRNFTLRELNVGTYYWSVQTIDYGYMASPFAPEGTFVIPPQAPTITTLGVLNVLVTGTTLNSRVNPNGASTTVWFEYGLTSAYGTSTAIQTIDGISPVLITSALTGLLRAATYHYRVVASNSFGIVRGPEQVFTTPQFTQLDIGFPRAPGIFAPADYDNDGDLDVLFTIHSASNTVLYRNNGSGQFTLSGITFPALNDASADWADYDRDGDLDLFLGGFSSSAIYRNEGGVSFSNIAANLPNNWTRGRWGDFDNDSDLDLLLSHGGMWQIYTNNAGQFSPAFSGAGTYGYTAIADYDKDGDLDFVITGTDSVGKPQTQLMRNDGASGFNDSGVTFPRVFGRAAWGDYDNDGDPDLLLSGATNNFAGSSAKVHLYRNDGLGVLTEIPTSLPNVNGNLLWADYDNDGDLDLAMSGVLNWPRHAGMFRNDGNGAFTEIESGFLHTSGDGLACGDFDNDGDLDFLISGSTNVTDYVARLYRNNNRTANAVPSAPTGLQMLAGNGTVTLSWQLAADANQIGGHSYNLRIGTSPGASDIVSPMSAAGGWRRVPSIGNTHLNPVWTLNLPMGTYYWSVQAIDNSFAGSPFAVESNFIRANAAPVAILQTVVLLEDSTRSFTLAGHDVDGHAVTYTLLSNPTNGTLTGIAPNIAYTPRQNFFGADTFTFRCSDGFTDSAPAPITLIVTPVQDSPTARLRLEKTAGLAPGSQQLTLTLTGEPYERYSIEASQDLIHWTSLTNLSSTDGLMTWTDPNVANFPWRFYRSGLFLPQPRLATFAAPNNRGFNLSLSGELSRTYQLQASTNLINWAPLTNILCTTSPLTYTDPAINHLRRFYRCVFP